MLFSAGMIDWGDIREVMDTVPEDAMPRPFNAEWMYFGVVVARVCPRPRCARRRGLCPPSPLPPACRAPTTAGRWWPVGPPPPPTAQLTVIV